MVESPGVLSEDHKEMLQTEENAVNRTIQLLDSEIARVRSEYERPGWTRWALFGAIASAVWLTMDSIEQGTFEIGNVKILFLAFSLMLYSLLGLRDLLERSQPDPSAAGRFRLTNRSFYLNRASLLLFLVHSVVVVAIARTAWVRVFWPFAVSVYVLYGLLALVSALTFVLTFFPYPLHLGVPQSSISRAFSGVLTIGSLVPAGAYLYSLSQSPIAVTVDDFRIAALLVVLFYLLRIFVGLEDETPILKSLITTRREFLLGRINIETAVQQTDIALAGLQVSDILHQDVSDLLDLLSTCGLEMQEVTKRGTAIRATIERIVESGEEPSEHTLSILESLFESSHSHLDKASETLDEINRRTDWFSGRTLLLARSAKEARPAIREVANRIRLATDELLERFNDLRETWVALRQYAEETLGASLNDENRQGIQEAEPSVIERVRKILGDEGSL